MAVIDVKSRAECKYDIVSLGEIMIRLDPGEERIHTTRHFRAWEGGGEYNVARGLKRCFGKRAAVVTAIADNPVGRLLEDLIYQGGVNMEYVKWVPYDGIGRKVRVGLNFTERGFGVRAAVGCSDRANSAASQLKKGDIDWENIFGRDGSCWFHTGGIFAALSETTPDVIIEAVKTAKEYDTIVSYDLNYRKSLWQDIGGQEKAMQVNRAIAPYVDVMLGNEEDFTAALENDYRSRQGISEPESSRHYPAKRKNRLGQRLGRDHIHRWRILRSRLEARPGNLRPGRRRRQFRFRVDLRPDGRKNAGRSGKLRRRSRRAGDDNAWRHHHSQPPRSRESHRRRRSESR